MFQVKISLLLLAISTMLFASCASEQKPTEHPTEVVLNCNGRNATAVTVKFEDRLVRRPSGSREETLTFRLEPNKKDIQLWDRNQKAFASICNSKPCLVQSDNAFSVALQNEADGENTKSVALMMDRQNGSLKYTSITAFGKQQLPILEYEYVGKCEKGDAINAASRKF